MKFLSYHEKKIRGRFDFPIELYYVDSIHPRYEMPFHWHMETELLLVLQGDFQLILDGEHHLLHTGESAFIPAGVVHGGTPHDCIYECIVFDFDRFFQDSNVCRQRFFQAFYAQEIPCCQFSVDSPPGKTVSSLFEVMRRECRGYEFITTGLLWQLVGLLIQNSCSESGEKSRQHTYRVEQIKDVLRLIRSDYNRTISLSDMAAKANMSPRYFCKVFHSIIGRTPVDYLNYYRVECAAELLRSTGERITEIALSCGFSDSAYFSRTFQKYKGCPPSTFRAMGDNGNMHISRSDAGV